VSDRQIVLALVAIAGACAVVLFVMNKAGGTM
jgi:hypothetical protein